MIKKKGQRSEIIQTIVQCLQLGVKVHIDQLNEQKRKGNFCLCTRSRSLICQ